MVSLIRTNWINVQEFVSASMLAGLRMEEIKGNKRDLRVRDERVCVRVGPCVCARMHVSEEKEEAREIEGERRKERK